MQHAQMNGNGKQHKYNGSQEDEEGHNLIYLISYSITTWSTSSFGS